MIFDRNRLQRPGRIGLIAGRGSPAQPKFNAVDGIVIFGFAILAIAWHVGRWKGIVPFVFLDIDGATLSSILAAQDHPALFAADGLLNDPMRTRFYWNLHIPLVRALSNLTGDYGTAYISLLGPIIFIQAVGFYFLGRVILKNRYWALLMASCHMVTVPVPVAFEYWGAFINPHPRLLFQALLPYLLAAAYHFSDQPRAWGWLMASCGLLFYVHPPSGLAWAAAIWLGNTAFLPVSWTKRSKLFFLLRTGFIFVAMVLPFAINYMFTHAHGSVDQAPGQLATEAVRAIWASYDGQKFFRTGVAVQKGYEWITSYPDSIYWAWAFFGGVIIWELDSTNKSRVLLAGLWVLGILFVSVGLPLIDEKISRACNMLRLELDLVRSVRYLVPIMILFCFWPLAEISRKLRNHAFIRTFVFLIGVILAGGWIHHGEGLSLETFKHWTKGSFKLPITEREKRIIELTAALREKTLPGATLVATPWNFTYPLPIRYGALRPLAFDVADHNFLSYSDPKGLLNFIQLKKEYDEATKPGQSALLSFKRLLAFSRKLGAEYMILNFDVDEAARNIDGAELIWSNQFFWLYQLSEVHTSKLPCLSQTPLNP